MDTQSARKSWVQAALLGVVLIAAMLVGGLVAVRVTGHGSPTVATSGQPASGGSTLQVSAVKEPATGGGNANAVAAIPNLPDLVDRVRPSVVAVNTVITGRNGARQGQG